MPLTDEEIIEQVIGGNTRAFETLVLRYQDLVFTLAFRIVKQRELAEEVAQDAFLRAYANLSSFRRRSRFSTWLYRITYNAALNAARLSQARSQRMAEPYSSDGGDILSIEGEGPNALSEIESNELAGIVSEHIDRLPSHYSAVLTLYHMQQLSYEEIADVTGLPLGTVKSHLYRGRALLRQSLEASFAKEELL